MSSQHSSIQSSVVGQQSPVKFLAAHTGFQAHSGALAVVLDVVVLDVVTLVLLSINGACDGRKLGLEEGRAPSFVFSVVEPVTGLDATGALETGLAVIGAMETVLGVVGAFATGFIVTGAVETGLAVMGAVEVGLLVTGAVDTGLAVMGALEVGLLVTGAAETGRDVMGAADTGAVAVVVLVVVATSTSFDTVVGGSFPSLHLPLQSTRAQGSSE